MEETITLDKKVLFDLLSFVAMYADDMATGISIQDENNIPEDYQFPQWNDLPFELGRHVEDILSSVTYRFLHRSDVSKTAQSIANYVSQADYASNRAEDDIALQCVTKALAALPSLEKQLMKFANDLNDTMAEAEENKVDLGY